MANSTTSGTSSCSSFPDDPERCDTVIIFRKVSASFSFTGCFFMIFIIWLFKRYVVFTQRMILYLSIVALFNSIAYLMSSTIKDGPVCDLQAWWLTFFDWTVLLWVCCITFNLYMNVIKGTTTEHFEWGYHALCWLLPLLMSLLPFIGDHYGPAGAWCWIKEDIKWRMGIWYGPLFIIILALFMTYIYIVIKLSRQASTWEGIYDPDTERNHRLIKEEIKPLRLYPFVYLIVSIFPLINRIQNSLSPNNAVFALMVLASISSPLHGALNALVFGMDKETLHKLRPTEILMAFSARIHRQEVREYPAAVGLTDDQEAIALRSKMAPRVFVQEYAHRESGQQTLANNDILQKETDDVS